MALSRALLFGRMPTQESLRCYATATDQRFKTRQCRGCIISLFFPSHLAFLIVAMIAIGLPTRIPAQENSMCKDFVGSRGFQTLNALVRQGQYGGRFKRGLELYLVEPGCSEEAIMSAMEAFGFLRDAKVRKFDTLRTRNIGGFQYNRILKFCAPHRNLLRRLFQSCGGGMYFFFNERQVTGVIAHGAS